MFSAPGRPVGSPREPQARRDSNPQPPVLETGALPIELRTSGLLLYCCFVLLCPRPAADLTWPGAESNCRHHDFQSCALPTELPGPDKKPARARSARAGVIRRGPSYRLSAPAHSRGLHVSETVQRTDVRIRTSLRSPTWETPPCGGASRAIAGAGFEPATFGL